MNELKHGFKTDSQNYHIKGRGNYLINLIASRCLFSLLSFIIYNTEKTSNSEVHSINETKCDVQLVNNNLIRYHKHMYYEGTNL